MDEQAEKNVKNLEVLIDGRVYTLAGTCSEEHLQRIGRHIDKKISEARRIKPITAYNFDLNTLYIMINLVDDLIYKTDRANTLESENARLIAENKKIKTEKDDITIKLSEANRQLDERKNAAPKPEAIKTEAVKKLP